MHRVLPILFAAALILSGSAEGQTYTYVDLGVTHYTDTFGASASNGNQAGYGLIGGQPQALMWQNSSSSATSLLTTIPQPLGPSAANMFVVGDSITTGVDGFPQNAPQGYPATMQSLGMGQHGASVYNLGAPGEHVYDMLGQYNGATGSTSVETTVTTTGGGNSATIGTATGVSTGMSIGAVGIPPNTTITAITGTTITLSRNATATESAVVCSIATPVTDIISGPSLYAGGAANGWTGFTNTAHQLSTAISGLPTYCFLLAGTNDITAVGPNTVTCTSVAGSPNLTITSGDASSFTNGDVVNGNNLPSDPVPYIVSGGGTNNLVLSAPAYGTGSFSLEQWRPKTPLLALEADYTAYVAAAHADGDTVANGGGVIAMTLLPRGITSNFVATVNNVLLTNFNAWLKSGASGADYVFDTNSAMPPFGPTQSPYYFSDLFHLSSAGTALLGTYINQQFFAQVDTAANNYTSSEALGIYSTFAAGYGVTPQNQSIALLWKGLTQPPVNLNPSFARSSVANGISVQTAGLAEAGSAILASTGRQVAVQWGSTAASASNLNPTGASSSQAYATVGSTGPTVGSAVLSGITEAISWNASGTVNLHPSGALRSEALAVNAYFGTTNGTVEAGDYTTSVANGGAVHACLWTGTAASMVDLHPATGYTSSTATGIVGTSGSSGVVYTAVGYGTKTNGTTVALVWPIVTQFPTDLSTYLPTGTTSSRAIAIDPTFNTIIGTAVINGSNHAFLLGPSGKASFLTPAQSLSTIVNVPYSYQVVAHGFPAPTYTSTSLPPGLSVSSTTGLIAGTPTQTGTFTGTVVATNVVNGSTLTASQAFTIKVIASPPIVMSIVASLAPVNGTGLHNAMVMGTDGNLYGTSTTGGAGLNGTIYEMTQGGVQTTIHAFNDGTVANDGSQPMGLTLGSDGTFYGTTYGGGSANNGTVFNINQGVTSILHSFTGGSLEGINPATSLFQATDGNFYGLTKFGGSLSGGTYFSITPSGTEKTYYNFGVIPGVSSNEFPDTPLIQEPQDTMGVSLYGTMELTFGAAFNVEASTASPYVLANFNKETPNAGYLPHGPLVAVTGFSTTSFYGIASAGGSTMYVNNETSDPTTDQVYGLGTIYNLAGATLIPLHSFGDGTVGNDGSNTADPNAPLVLGPDGNLYGVTPAGGSANQGTLFQITPSGAMIVLHSFGDGTIANDGLVPGPAFFLGSDGYFYGVTEKGGANGNGAIYKFSINDVPVLSSTQPPKGVVGVPYSFTFTSTSAPGFSAPTYALVAQNSSVPPGLTLSSTGVFSGTPTTPGRYFIEFTASDSAGTSAPQDFAIQITQAPSITSTPLSVNIPVGVPYSFAYTATNKPSFTTTSGALPTGLTLSSTGVISGTPTTVGAYTGTIDAGNGTLPDATQGFSITVTNTFASWAKQNGLSGASAAQTAVLEPDGLSNLFKYALGLNPAVNYNPGAPGLPLVQTQNLPGGEYLTLTFNGVAADVTYTVQAADDPSGSWSKIVTYGGQPPPGTVVVQDTQVVGYSSARYMRLQITSP